MLPPYRQSMVGPVLSRMVSVMSQGQEEVAFYALRHCKGDNYLQESSSYSHFLAWLSGAPCELLVLKGQRLRSSASCSHQILFWKVGICCSCFIKGQMEPLAWTDILLLSHSPMSGVAAVHQDT